jgi:hypothetical protein
MRSQRYLKVMNASFIAAFMVLPMRADATIHEIVAAFCSGGGKGVISDDGHLEAPGVSDSTKKNFARPVIASQSTVTVSESPLQIVISDSNAAKYPEGTIVIDLGVFKLLLVSESDHPAIHCRNFSSLP